MPLDEDTLQTLKRIREDLELDQDIEEEVSKYHYQTPIWPWKSAKKLVLS